MEASGSGLGPLHKGAQSICLQTLSVTVPISLGHGPLIGNGGSLDKCRRRWDICDDPNLRYKSMVAFDRAMIHMDKVWTRVWMRLLRSNLGPMGVGTMGFKQSSLLNGGGRG